MYEETGRYPVENDPDAPPSNVISTSQAINLTTTLASLSMLFALFLCFADQRSRAVRRFSVQSVGLGVLHLLIAMLCWILGALLGWVPLVGALVRVILWIAFIGATAVVLFLRVRMMYHAYRGIAYVLPGIGEKLRKYE